MFDFPNARAPELTPLAHSFEPGDYRDQIKQLAIALFQDKLGAAAFDANVLGMAHLGSFDLVRRNIQADGLGMLRSDREEAATRYLYRAWKKSDAQGRGLHFLRLYLQLLYPHDWIVDQLEHAKNAVYPHGTRAYTGADDHFLTSRLFVQIDANANNAPMFASFVPVFSSILPARFVPHFSAFKNVFIGTDILKLRNRTGTGVGLGAVGHSTPNLHLSQDCFAFPQHSIEMFGQSRGSAVPTAIKMIGRTGAVMFGSNAYSRFQCPVVRLASAQWCLENAARDPNLRDNQQAILSVKSLSPSQMGLGIIVTDRRALALRQWPHGLPELPVQMFDGISSGGLLQITAHDALFGEQPDQPQEPLNIAITPHLQAALLAHNTRGRVPIPAVRFVTLEWLREYDQLDPEIPVAQQAVLQLRPIAQMPAVAVIQPQQTPAVTPRIQPTPAMAFFGSTDYQRIHLPAVRIAQLGQVEQPAPNTQIIRTLAQPAAAVLGFKEFARITAPAVHIVTPKPIEPPNPHVGFIELTPTAKATLFGHNNSARIAQPTAVRLATADRVVTPEPVLQSATMVADTGAALFGDSTATDQLSLSAQLPVTSAVDLLASATASETPRIDAQVKTQTAAAVFGNHAYNGIAPQQVSIPRSISVGIFGNTEFTRLPIPSIRLASAKWLAATDALDPTVPQLQQSVLQFNAPAAHVELKTTVSDVSAHGVTTPLARAATVAIGGYPRFERILPPAIKVASASWQESQAQINSTPNAAMFGHYAQKSLLDAQSVTPRLVSTALFGNTEFTRLPIPSIRLASAKWLAATDALDPTVPQLQQSVLQFNAPAAHVELKTTVTDAQASGNFTALSLPTGIAFFGHPEFNRIASPAVRITQVITPTAPLPTWRIVAAPTALLFGNNSALSDLGLPLITASSETAELFAQGMQAASVSLGFNAQITSTLVLFGQHQRPLEMSLPIQGLQQVSTALFGNTEFVRFPLPAIRLASVQPLESDALNQSVIPAVAIAPLVDVFGACSAAHSLQLTAKIQSQSSVALFGFQSFAVPPTPAVRIASAQYPLAGEFSVVANHAVAAELLAVVTDTRMGMWITAEVGLGIAAVTTGQK